MVKASMDEQSTWPRLSRYLMNVYCVLIPKGRQDLIYLCRLPWPHQCYAWAQKALVKVDCVLTSNHHIINVLKVKAPCLRFMNKDFDFLINYYLWDLKVSYVIEYLTHCHNGHHIDNGDSNIMSVLSDS